MEIQETIPTEKQIAGAISAMRDSVWVINSEMEKTPSKESIESIQRNVAHLELQMSNEHISNFDDDFIDINQAILSGKEFLEIHKSILIEDENLN